MIGIVTPERTATVSLSVVGRSGHRMVSAVLDTGFTDSLTLPLADIQLLGLDWRGSQRAELADGQIVTFDLFRAEVDWDGEIRSVLVHCAETVPLLGMSLMYGSRLSIDVVDGGSVRLEPI